MDYIEKINTKIIIIIITFFVYYYYISEMLNKLGFEILKTLSTFCNDFVYVKQRFTSILGVTVCFIISTLCFFKK